MISSAKPTHIIFRNCNNEGVFVLQGLILGNKRPPFVWDDRDSSRNDSELCVPGGKVHLFLLIFYIALNNRYLTDKLLN